MRNTLSSISPVLLALGGRCGAWAVCLLGLACASPNVNRPTAQVHTGYVDFSLSNPQSLAWEIQRFDRRENRFRPVFSQVNPVQEPVIRLAFPPGTEQLRVTFNDRVILEPAIIDVTLDDGKITPVQVSLVSAGTASVETRQQSWGGTAKGRYGRRMEVGSYDAQAFKVVATVGPPKPYTPK